MGGDTRDTRADHLADVGRSLAASLLGDVDLTTPRRRSAPAQGTPSGTGPGPGAGQVDSSAATPAPQSSAAPATVHTSVRSTSADGSTHRARPVEVVDDDVIDVDVDIGTADADVNPSGPRSTRYDGPDRRRATVRFAGRDRRRGRLEPDPHSLAWAADLMSSLPWDADDDSGPVIVRRGAAHPDDSAGSVTPGAAPDPPRVIVLDRSEEGHSADDEAPTVLRSVLEWLLVITAAVTAAMAVQAFAFRIYEIPSSSMSPTLETGDRVVVNKLSYTLGGDPTRGDVIVFDNPERDADDPPAVPELLIKRVVAVAGDVVTEEGGVLHVNDRPVDEPQLAAGSVTNNLAEPVVVPEDHLFVLGDNRERSHDSRFFGPIDDETVVGRASTIVWPFDRFGML